MRLATRSSKLKAVLEQLRGGKNVQNRQLRTLLGGEGYTQFEDEWRQQQELRVTLADKPKEVLEYERRLKEATFAYGKADAASGQGRYKAAKDLMAISDAKLESLIEFLSERFEGRADLERWLDRSVQLDFKNAPSLCPSAFPVVVTSRSLRNEGGGLASMKRTKRQVKIEAVERELETLRSGDVGKGEVARRLAIGRNLRTLASD